MGAWADPSWTCWQKSGFCRRIAKQKEAIRDLETNAVNWQTFPDDELYLLGGGKAKSVYGGANCIDCLGTWRNNQTAWNIDESLFHGWQTNSYDYVEVFNDTERVHNVLGLDHYRLPPHATIGRWVESTWSCAGTSAFCSRRYRFSEFDVANGWGTAAITQGADGYTAQRTFVLDTIT